MTTLTELSAVLVGLITAGSVLRLIYCLIMTAHSDDAQVYRKRAKHVLVFLVLAVSVSSIAGMVLYYYR